MRVPPYSCGMGQQPAAMHVARIRSSHVDRQGRRRDYESRYLRRTYRDGGKVRHETLANLSGLPEQTVDAIEAALKGTPLVPAGQAVTITASLPHGHVAAVHAMAARLGLPALLGPACRRARPGAGADRLPGGGPGLQAVHADVVGRHHAGDRPGRRRRVHRRHLRGDGLAGGPAGRDRGEARRPAPGTGAEPGADGAVRPVVLVAGRHALPAGRPRLLPGRQEGQAADRVRAAHRPGGPPGRGPGAARQHRRPGRVHPDRAGRAGQVRPGQDGHGRRPRHDHQRPDRGPEPAGGRDGPAGPLRVDHRAARPGHQKAHGRRRPAPASACSTSRTWPRSPARTTPASG